MQLVVTPDPPHVRHAGIGATSGDDRCLAVSPSLWGPVIGAALLVPLSKKLLDAYASDYLRGIQGVVYGAAVIAIILRGA